MADPGGKEPKEAKGFSRWFSDEKKAKLKEKAAGGLTKAKQMGAELKNQKQRTKEKMGFPRTYS